MCRCGTNAVKSAHSHRASSSGPFTIGVLGPLSIRNAIVTGDFLRSDPNAVVRLIFSTLILARDLKAWRVDLVPTEHLALSNQYLTHSVLITAYKQAISQRSANRRRTTKVEYESAHRRLNLSQRQV